MKLSSSGDAYFQIKDSESDTNNQKVLEIKNDQNFVLIEKQESPNNNLLNCSTDSPALRKSAPSTPSKMSRHFEKLNCEDCIVVAEELKENEVIDQIHAIPSVPIKKNNLSPKNNTNCLTVHDIRSSLHYNSVELSLCLSEILKNPEKAEEIFLNKMIKKEEFFKDPWKYLNNSNLLICYEDKLYTYKTAIPIILSLLTYGELPPQDTINELSLNGGLFGFFRSNKNQAQLNNIKVHIEHKDDMNLVSEKKEITRKESLSKLKRSFIPTSDQLKLLNLKYGRNEIKFVCQSRLSGVQSLSADIYLWDHESKIVISDIDGTITRSDVLGQIMPMIGKDWSHEGVTDLFTNIDKNGYKILYLTARAICQASATKNYIQTLFQNESSLPRGPVLMSPDGLISSFKREVIDRTPQTFKIACLTEIKNLFPSNYSPFYSGFGNRTTDAVSYRSVGIELSKIFIINEQGEVIQLNNSYKKTYTLINQIVDELFPALN